MTRPARSPRVSACVCVFIALINHGETFHSYRGPLAKTRSDVLIMFYSVANCNPSCAAAQCCPRGMRVSLKINYLFSGNGDCPIVCVCVWWFWCYEALLLPPRWDEYHREPQGINYTPTHGLREVHEFAEKTVTSLFGVEDSISNTGGDAVIFLEKGELKPQWLIWFSAQEAHFAACTCVAA